MAPSFWRRHRTKILAAAAAGAAGAAAAYYWWYSTEEEAEEGGDPEVEGEEARDRCQTSSTAEQFLDRLQATINAEQRHVRPGEAAGAPAAAGDAQASTSQPSALDESLQRHFHSIQDLSDRQALEDLLPRLRAILFEATDFDALKEQIRARSGEAGTSDEDPEKLQQWQQLAQLCFTRTMAACWLVPLLDLLVRMKLHIVGRHMYLESKLPEMAPRGRGASFSRMRMPPRLGDRAKEVFFKSDYFIEVGARAVIAKMAAAAEQVLAGVDFGSHVGPSDIEALVAAMHAHFEAEFEQGGDAWEAYLLPPGQQQVGSSSPAGTQYLVSPVEAAMVDELQSELRDVLAFYRFGDALRSAVRHTSRVTGTYVASRFGAGRAASSDVLHHLAADPPPAAAAATPSGLGSPSRVNLAALPRKQFAYAVPVVARSCQLLFDETHMCTKGISSLQPVQALCASVFTCGPRFL